MKKLLPITVLLWVGLVSGYAQNKPRSEQIRNIHISQLVADGNRNGSQVVALGSDGQTLILKELPALEIQATDITDWNEAVTLANMFNIANPQPNQLLRYNSSSGKWENWTPDFLKSAGTIDVAKKLETARTISLTGDVTASGTFDGSANLPLNAQIASGAITNDEVSSFAAIAGTKISPNFGDQDIFTNQTVNAIGGLILGKDGGGQLGSIVFRDEGSPPNTLTLRPPKKINNPSYTLIFPEKAPNDSELLQIQGIDTSDPQNTVGTLEWASSSQYSAQTLTAATATPSVGANLNLSQSGGTVRLYGDGATSVTYEADNTIKIYSTDTSGPYYSSGSGISISGNTISATTASFTDEAQTLSAAGSTSPTINLSPVGSTGGGTITLAATSPIKLAQNSNTITISSDALTNMSIADDITFASPVYPLWAAGTGTQPLKISTTKLGFIPSKGVIIANGMIIHGDENVTGGAYPTGDNIRIGKSSTGVAPIGQRNIAIGTESMKTLMLAGNAIDNVGIGFNTLNKMVSGNSNIAIGSYALEASQTADFNMAIGEGAFKVLDEPESDGNIAIGFYAGSEKVNPKYTTVIGTRAFELGEGGEGNTSLGYYTLHKTTGNNNTAIGASALVENTTGSGNTAIGRSALNKNTTVSELTAVGYEALSLNTLGEKNTAIGFKSLNVNTTGSYNTAAGNSALLNNTTGLFNTAMGADALYANTTGKHNTALGNGSLTLNDTGDNNTAVGHLSLPSNKAGKENSSLGSMSLFWNSTGSNNTAIGSEALRDNTTVSELTAVGYQALGKNTTGERNAAIGFKALGLHPAGNDNVAVGHSAMAATTGGYSNVAIGANALGQTSNTGTDNIAIGHSALANNHANVNVAIGTAALIANQSGGANTAIGYRTLYSNISGQFNVAIGEMALMDSKETGNTGVGTYSLRNLKTGSNNTALGYDAGYFLNSSTNSILIGYSSDGTDGGDNEIVIGAFANGHGSNTINLNSQREPRLFIGNSAPNDRVYYEPLYYNRVGALGTVLAGQGTGVMPVWKGITITSSDGTVGFGPEQDTDNLKWDLSVTCCKPLNLMGSGDISVTQGATSQDWTISYFDADKDPTNEIEKLQVDPTTGEISLVGADGRPIPVVDQDGKEVLGSDGKPLKSIVFSGLTFDPVTKTFKLPCPCDEVVKGKIMIEQSMELTAKAGQTLFDLTVAPDVDSKLKMYINGLRISNTAYTVEGTKLTYHPELNVLQGSLHGGELIQFDYSSSQ